MKKIYIIETLFLAYIALIVIFNLVTIPRIALPIGQFIFSLILILAVTAFVVEIPSERKFVWWGLFATSLLGVFRPTMEYIFSLQVPGVAASFFPPFTPTFSIFGFLLMLIALILLLDPGIQKLFDKQ